MLQQLREHRAAQNEALLKAGVRTDLVFASSDGTPLQRRNVSRRYFKPALRAAGLCEALSLYALRHSCATLLLQANVHPKIVAESRTQQRHAHNGRLQSRAADNAVRSNGSARMDAVRLNLAS
jgi:site-specific recombinase XerC